MKKIGIGKIGVISGRYYSMDRDERWDRLKLSYDALTIGLGLHCSSSKVAIDHSYDCEITDEFVKPTLLSSRPLISDNDSIICFNFRPDRVRQITRAFVDPDFDGFHRLISPENLSYVCFTEYDKTMPNVEVAFPPEALKNTLGEYVSSLGLRQLRIAETEKYAHVTFFFNGGVEAPNKNEDHILVHSPNVATYDLQPEMSAPELTAKVVEAIDSDKYDLIILNFANADMVGHSGNIPATIKAIETLDSCVSKVSNAILEKDGSLILTADHGNADYMLNSGGGKVTAHSTNPVPVVLISNKDYKLKNGGALCDLAPTLLDLMDLEKPKEMTGESLIK